MIHPNGHDPSTATIPAAPSETIQTPLETPPAVAQPLDIATRTKLRARQQFQQNRFVIIGAGALVVALLIFVATSIPHKNPVQKTKAGATAVKDYRLAARRLPPGATTEGTVVFERPAFKESREQLLLQIAQAEEVDRPVLAPIAFVAPAKGAAK